MLSPYGKREWMMILVIGGGLTATLLALDMAIWTIPVVLVTVALLAFFRDPDRPIPADDGVMVSPADGHVSSIHEVDHYEPFGEGATCVRIFLSLLDVHGNRSPCAGRVARLTWKPGQHLNVLNPESAEVNEFNLIELVDLEDGHPVATVRQVAGLIARTIVCGVKQGDVVERGERIGLIKFGSTTELFVPKSAHPQVMVKQGQKVVGGKTILVQLAVDEDQEEQPVESREAAVAD